MSKQFHPEDRQRLMIAGFIMVAEEVSKRLTHSLRRFRQGRLRKVCKPNRNVCRVFELGRRQCPRFKGANQLLHFIIGAKIFRLHVSATYTFLSSVYPSIAAIPRSRPIPLCLNPPNGASTCTLLCELTLTTPLSIRRETRNALLRSLVQSEALNPYGELFTSRSICSSSVNG